MNWQIFICKAVKMYFEAGHLYHIFNQGNNRQLIFYKRENYEFFLKKLSEFIKPYADILAWCLMPNHFHILIHTNQILCSILNRSQNNPMQRTLNDSLGVMLRSYTRAINNQEYRTGSLFRRATKAVCVSESEKLSENWIKSMGITICNNIPDEMMYPNICFNYILFNPVKAGLVKTPEEWEFSSCREYLGLSNEQIINKARIREVGLRYSGLH